MLQVEGLETIAGSFRLRGVTLTAPSGSYGVLLGPPGSGKSVLVETICGLRAPTAGRILIARRREMPPLGGPNPDAPAGLAHLQHLDAVSADVQPDRPTFSRREKRHPSRSFP